MASVPSEPQTRKEQYLSAIAGLTTEYPEYPITREEAYLDEIARNGGGGGGGTNDYEKLHNLPKINNVELKGNKSLSDLGIRNVTIVDHGIVL